VQLHAGPVDRRRFPRCDLRSPRSQQGKPVWRLVVDMTPEERLRLIDFKYIEDAITPEEALEIFRRAEVGKAERIKEMEETGYLAYITSTGWIAYTAEQVRDLTAEALKTGLKYIKIKVGSDIDSDIARLRAVREVLGPDRFLMVDANQKWGVKQAIEWMERLAPFKPLWIEEPTSPDDILGHKAVRDALYPKYGIGVATGEVRTVGCRSGRATRPQVFVGIRPQASRASGRQM